MDISIIIPNYNGEELLKNNLSRIFDELESYKSGKAEIIVVDDFSSDQSLRYLSNFSKEHPLLKVLRNEKNLGFEPTVNNGVKQANGEIVILLNTDVCPQKGFLEPLLKHFSNKKIFAVGCLDESIENGRTVLRGRGLGDWKRGLLIHRKGEVDKKNTLWVAGGSGAFKKEIWEKLGGLNELYAPFYWEDIDICYRALKSGYEIVFEPKSIVIHKHQEGAIKKTYSEKEVKIIAYRNQFIFVWENADLNMILLHILWLPIHMVKALTRFDLVFFTGFLKALVLLPKIIKLRGKSTKSFVKSDQEVIKLVNA